MLPIYGALHVIPMLLFRRQRVLKDPLHMLLRASWGTARSSAFLGVFVFIYQCAWLSAGLVSLPCGECIWHAEYSARSVLLLETQPV